MDRAASLNRRGMFPGPHESEEDFFQRASSKEALAFPEDAEPLSAGDWEAAQTQIMTRLGCHPDRMSAYYSNRGLSFWQGAATWIEKGRAVIQLRKGFKKGRYLGIYTREEVLAHELAHGCRETFDEPRYEEIFAYALSSHPWRAYVGPLFRSSWEPALFLALTAAASLGSLLYREALWFFSALLLVYLLFLELRLFLARKTLQRALSNLEALVPQPLAFAFRLSDEEIALFSRLSSEEIKLYIQKENSFRWRFLRAAYAISGEKQPVPK